MASRPPPKPPAASPRRPPQAKRAGSPASGARVQAYLSPAGVDSSSSSSSSAAAVGSNPGNSSSYGTSTNNSSIPTSTGASNSRHEGELNPQVTAIQSRVADLVRRFDECVAERVAVSDDDDDDNDDCGGTGSGRGGFDVPAHWRVGDVLLAAHRALAKSGEQTLAADSEDDPEVAEALGGVDESGFARVAQEAARSAQQMRQALARTLATVRQLQRSDGEQRLVTQRAAGEQGAHVRELRTALEVLQREKSVVLVQLQEQARAHRELLAALDAQHQELRRAQLATTSKSDELRAARDDCERRLGDAQRALDTALESAGAWRDKYQSAARSLLAAEQRTAELEAKAQTQAAEIAKRDVVLQAKAQEEKTREKLRDGELQRLRAEVAATAAQAVADSRVTRGDEGSEQQQQKKKKKEKEEQVVLVQEQQALRAKLQQAEATIRGLQSALSDELHSKRQCESDNSELSRLVVEMKARAHKVMGGDALPSSEPEVEKGATMPKKATGFALSLRALSQKRRVMREDGDDGGGGGEGGGRGGGSKATAASATSSNDAVSDAANDADDDDLSTSSDDDDDDDDDADLEIAQEERELNAAVQQVVTLVFPQHRRTLEQSDEHLSRDIALYEDLALSPTGSRRDSRSVQTPKLLELPPLPTSLLSSSSPSLSLAPSTSTPLPTAAAAGGVPLSTGPLNEVERMKLACDDELARMKTQYASSLLEYKRLIIEQYERRQAQVHEQHRAEIGNLILLVQEKFRREVERRGAEMLRTKESLKLLYRAMKGGGDDGGSGGGSGGGDNGGSGGGGDGGDGDGGGGVAFDRPTSPSSSSGGGGGSGGAAACGGGGGGEPETPEQSPVPLKVLLRAAVFALSSSRKRASAASAEIKQIYEAVKRQKEEEEDGGSDSLGRRAAPNLLLSPRIATPSKIAVETMTPVDEETDPARPRGASLVSAHVGCQVCEEDFAALKFARGFRGSAVTPERMDGYVLSSSSLFENQSSRLGSSQQQSSTGKSRHHREGSSNNTGGRYGASDDASAGCVLHLVEGAMLSDEIVAELREVLPALPVGVYYLSRALKHKLLLEVLRFYSVWDARRCHLPTIGALDCSGGGSGSDDSGDVEVVVGSPRDTPFMRRKAVESVQKQQRARQRRAVLAAGGEAIVSQPSGAGVGAGVGVGAGMVAWPTPRSSPRVTL